MAVGLVALAAGACLPAVEGPNVLVIVIDSLRADRLHHAGDPRPLSPNIDRFAGEASRFLQARTSAPWTTPSVMTLFTGLAPTTHHVDSNDHQLDASVRTLAERFRQAGYRTGAVMPALTLAGHFGFDRGFDRFVLEVQGHGKVSGAWSVQEAVTFLREDGPPFFLYVHFWDVHYNYNPPVPHALRFQAGRRAGPGETDDVTALIRFSGRPDEVEPLPEDRVAWLEGQYAGEILFTDAQVARLLEELERLDLAGNTIVVVTADHGEAFQEHGVLGHTVHLYEEVERIPLLVRWPDRVRAGRELRQPVGLIDVAPTLLDLAGVPFERTEFEGHSRAAALLGGEDHLPAGSDSELLMATTRRARLRGLISPETAYIFDHARGGEELYDLAQDPGQRANLAAARPEEARLWRRKLCDRLGRLPERGEVPAVELPAAVREMLDAGLQQLGYVGPGRKTDGDQPSPSPPRHDPAAERRAYLEELGCSGDTSAPPVR